MTNQEKLNQEKLDKFIHRIENFIFEVKKSNTLKVHNQINQFFYMQKLEELKVLIERVKEGVERLEILEEQLKTSRREIFIAWKRDARWLIQHKAQEKLTASELPTN